MKTKNNLLMFVALFAALITFACGGGAIATATSAPAEVTPAVESTEPVTQMEGELEITNSTSYIDGFNDYTVVGEIQNNTNKTLENITLSLSITDESGATLLKDENDSPVDSIEFNPTLACLTQVS
jgi:membrane-associated protease RseP (regulator of RpoE activity)